MTKDFASLLAQIVPVLAIAIGLELRALSKRLGEVRTDHQTHPREWAEQFEKRYKELEAVLSEARAEGRWGWSATRRRFRALRDLRATDSSSELGQAGMVAFLVLGLVVGQAYLAGVEFYSLTVAAGVRYRALESVLSVDLFAQLRSAIDIAFLVPAVEAAYRAIVFAHPLRGEQGRRFVTVVLVIGGVLVLRIALGLLFG